MAKKNEDHTGLAIGGGFMLGLGVGFFLLRVSALWFVGSIVAGIGLGLMVGAMIKRG